MNEREQRLDKVAEQKRKIRERYRGINPDELEVIPALPEASLDYTDREQRVAVYARVSTDDPRQTSSYELQKNHYLDVVSRHPGWNLTEIYADEGISGTSLNHRDSFVRMIEDCKKGKIDLIITKSVSRFARNVLDCIGYARELKALQPPIGIFFETENIFTLNGNSEMSLSFIATLAQEESHTKSEVMNASIEMRFRRGIFLTPPLLGYDNDEDGKLIINEEEAPTVRLIFFLYLYGYSCQKIADQLTLLKLPTKKGNTVWAAGSVLGILQNERYCGDVLSRKTYTPDFLDHKSKKNKQNRTQYRKKDNHEAIISRDDFIAVQHLISNAKYRNTAILPELKVITSGPLLGYVSVNPRWAGFKADDYISASESVTNDMNPKSFDPDPGSFDLRNFQVVSNQFIETAGKSTITFSASVLTFSTECVHKLDTEYVEMFIHPKHKMFALRPTTKENRNAIQWAKQHNGLKVPRQVGGAAFLPNLFELLDWNTERKYRIIGIKKQNEAETVVLFHLYEPEVFIPHSEGAEEESGHSSPTADFDSDMKVIGTKSSTIAYPPEWANTFGNNYYHQAQSDDFPSDAEKSEEIIFKTRPELNITKQEEIENHIQLMTVGHAQEVSND